MHSWLGLAMGDVSTLGLQVIDSSGAYATPYSFFTTMQNYNPDIVIADGHGDPNTLTGQGLQEVLKACFNNEVLSGKIMCAVSCLTGQGLGPDSRNKQADAYIGFVNPFQWAIDPIAYPTADQIAYPFQQVIRKMASLSCQHQLDQINLRELHSGVVAEFENWEKYYSVPPGSEVVDSAGTPRAADILLSLRSDKTGLITLGKEERYAYPPMIAGIPLVPLAPLALGSLLAFWPF